MSVYIANSLVVCRMHVLPHMQRIGHSVADCPAGLGLPHWLWEQWYSQLSQTGWQDVELRRFEEKMMTIHIPSAASNTKYKETRISTLQTGQWVLYSCPWMRLCIRRQIQFILANLVPILQTGVSVSNSAWNVWFKFPYRGCGWTWFRWYMHSAPLYGTAYHYQSSLYTIN